MSPFHSFPIFLIQSLAEITRRVHHNPVVFPACSVPPVFPWPSSLSAVLPDEALNMKITHTSFYVNFILSKLEQHSALLVIAWQAGLPRVVQRTSHHPK